MFTAPPPRPVTTPIVLTIALKVLLLLHVPPEGEPDKVTGEPTHTELLPEMVGDALTVMVLYAKQPPVVYVIFTIPAEMPVITPEERTVAMAVLLLLHVPPEKDAESVRVSPTHTGPSPEMSGVVLIVIVL